MNRPMNRPRPRPRPSRSIQYSRYSPATLSLGGCSRCTPATGSYWSEEWRVASVAVRSPPRAFKLVKICDGRFKPDNKHRFQTLAIGGLPRKFTQWPDALADPDDVRPVDRLRHTGSEWVRDSQVDVAVFTQRGRLQKFPACPRPRVSWDPYSV